MSALETLIFEDGDDSFPIRITDQAGMPWFIAKDACAPLGYGNHRDAVSVLDDDDKGVATSDTLGGPQDVTIISLRGLATLMVRSQQALASGTRAWRFRRWILGTVLEQIFKTGSYAIPEADPTTDWDWDVIAQKVMLVREMRLSAGKKASAALWRVLGLPTADEPPQPARTASETGVDFVRAFLADRTEEQPGGRVQAGPLYAAYCDWARETSSPSITNVAFARCLDALGIEKSRANYHYYLGIRIKHRLEIDG